MKLKNRELQLLATYAHVSWGFELEYVENLFIHFEKMQKLDKEMSLWPSADQNKAKQAILQAARRDFMLNGQLSDKAANALKENFKDYRKFTNRLTSYNKNRIEMRDKLNKFIESAKERGFDAHDLLKSWKKYLE